MSTTTNASAFAKNPGWEFYGSNVLPCHWLSNDQMFPAASRTWLPVVCGRVHPHWRLHLPKFLLSKIANATENEDWILCPSTACPLCQPLDFFPVKVWTPWYQVAGFKLETSPSEASCRRTGFGTIVCMCVALSQDYSPLGQIVPSSTISGTLRWKLHDSPVLGSLGIVFGMNRPSWNANHVWQRIVLLSTIRLFFSVYLVQTRKFSTKVSTVINF